MVQNIENNQAINANEIKPFNNEEDMKKVNEVVAMKLQAVEEARKNLTEKETISYRQCRCGSQYQKVGRSQCKKGRKSMS